VEVNGRRPADARSRPFTVSPERQFFAWANRNSYTGNPVRDVKVDKPARRSR
jgi:hypothetical protein